MHWIDLAHRWMGGLIGLLLALIGLSGAALVHRDAWTIVPHKGDAVVQDTDRIAAAVATIMSSPTSCPQSITFASPGFGIDRLAFESEAGAYTDQAGHMLVRWQGRWGRPELWLADFHEHLFSGDAGETVVGVTGLAGSVFVVTGSILWWRTRRTFAFRLLPKRMSRSAILRHHRDMGIVIAPLLLLSSVTGGVLVFRPLSSVLLGPGATAAIVASSKQPSFTTGSSATQVDWVQLARTARARFPEAEFRTLSLPLKPGGSITLRMKQPWEWLPNGRTTLWFAADGKLIAASDPARSPAQVRAYNLLYPLHSGKVGGFAYQLMMTASGLTLTLLGTLTAWTFWFERKPTPWRSVAR